MSEHPIKGMMDSAMENIRKFIDVNTIIGDPITAPDGTVVIPVSKVSYGFGAGGSELPTKSEKQLFGGGSGMGINISPVAFIVLQNGDAKLLHIADSSEPVNNVIKLVPEVIDKITAFINKKKDEKSAGAAPAEEE